jgi:hypothetical protein
MTAAVGAGCVPVPDTCDEHNRCNDAGETDALTPVDSSSPPDDARSDGGVPGDAHVDPSCGICPIPPNGSSTCVSGQCVSSCNATFHDCNGTCMSDDSAPADDPCVVTTGRGVFVSPTGSDATGTGALTAPYATVGAAGAAATAKGAKNIYVCGGNYTGSIDLGAAMDGLRVYGGLRCADWKYDATAVAAFASGTAGPALRLHDLTKGITFVDSSFTSTNASGNGATSNAVFVANAANVVFQRVTMTAGNGSDAAAVTTVSNYTGASAPAGKEGTGGTGGQGGAAACTSYGTSAGGKGGDGVAGATGNGGNGVAVPAASDPLYTGAGGAVSAVTCAPGTPGANGSARTAANGASVWGTLNAAGWTAARGEPGLPGNPGQGGGGGGGKTNPAPAGGAGGGAGGCGGGGGQGGPGGGSSFALLSYQSSALLDSCTLAAGSGGKGGDGAPGEQGQAGGAAAGTATSCPGGSGGSGPGGGAGGGGAGGLSAAIGYLGTIPTLEPHTTTSIKTAGAAGNGVTKQASGGSSGATPAASAGPTSTPGKAGQASMLPLLLGP